MFRQRRRSHLKKGEVAPITRRMWRKRSMATERRRRVVLTAVGTALWCGALLLALGRMWTYSMAPGAASSVPQHWPGSSLVTHSSTRATLIMFLHPRCTCSDASLIELAADRKRSSRRSCPVGADPRASRCAGGLGRHVDRRARAPLPNATIVLDRSGAEARRFGVTTSGHVVVYDAARTLQFSGGITGARGHVGDNEGLRSVVAVLRGDPTSRHTHPTLGCGLLDRDGPPS